LLFKHFRHYKNAYPKFAAMTFSATYQHAYSHKDRKWYIEEISSNFKLSAKGEIPHGSVVPCA